MSHIHLPHDHGHNSIDEFVSSLPGTADFSTASSLFHQLSDPNRLRIFWILCHFEECVINISAMMEMSSPAVSHHLKQLKSAGLIVSRRDGKEVYYKAANTTPASVLHDMIGSVLSLSCPDSCSF